MDGGPGAARGLSAVVERRPDGGAICDAEIDASTCPAAPGSDGVGGVVPDEVHARLLRYVAEVALRAPVTIDDLRVVADLVIAPGRRAAVQVLLGPLRHGVAHARVASTGPHGRLRLHAEAVLCAAAPAPAGP